MVWGSRLGGMGSQGILAAAVDPQSGDVFAAGFTGDESGGWVGLVDWLVGGLIGGGGGGGGGVVVCTLL